LARGLEAKVRSFHGSSKLPFPEMKNGGLADERRAGQQVPAGDGGGGRKKRHAQAGLEQCLHGGISAVP
jgi:hypothetical protein